VKYGKQEWEYGKLGISWTSADTMGTVKGTAMKK